MAKKYSVFLSALLFSLTTWAQQTSLTVAFTQDKIPVQNATAQLFRLPDSILVDTKTMNTTIVFDVQQHSDYFLQVTAVNIQDIRRMLKVGNLPLNILLEPKLKTNDLQNVTITARKPLVKQEDDKTIVDAEVLANSSTNAYEVLEKTPGAVVDQDGNVYLNSATPATIFINGREVKLGSQDLASLLKSLPANSVAKIEILRNPSAKYDAASSGGIVNIVLKKGIKLGTSGSVNLAHFQGKYGTTSVGMNLNKSINKITSYFSYQFTKRNNLEDLSSKRYLNAEQCCRNIRIQNIRAAIITQAPELITR
ncbi:MAG: TonB-dependent receptor [Ferruginibacter sp.]|nr:TonB-dependent receptor [Ferruginibacter sp.]